MAKYLKPGDTFYSDYHKTNYKVEIPVGGNVCFECDFYDKVKRKCTGVLEETGYCYPK